MFFSTEVRERHFRRWRHRGALNSPRAFQSSLFFCSFSSAAFISVKTALNPVLIKRIAQSGATYRLDGCIVQNAHNTVFGLKRSAYGDTAAT